ncbi:MAG TPA: YbaK/EbsC family protein [Gaiellaceae bacterium]|nr:YbaK/EbsC family protein [Gaiellaceae bacterium]
MTGTELLTGELERLGIEYELLGHDPTNRAVDEATSLGLRPDEIAKTIVVTTGAENLRVLLPASERVDIHKLRDVLSAGKELHLLTEEALGSDYPEFELGAVPPFGGRDDGVILDRRLAALEELVFEAGTHDHSARVKAADLVELAGARVEDICMN